jgi:hypothetical protein
MQSDHLLIATALDALHGSGGSVAGRAFLFPCSEIDVSIFEFDVHIAEVAIGKVKLYLLKSQPNRGCLTAHEGAG